MISAKDIDTIRSIARAGYDYNTIKRLLAETQWEIEDDDVDLGFLRVFIPDAADGCYRLIIGYRDPDHPPYSLLTFSLFPDSEEHVAKFNSAFQSVAKTLTRYFGAPTASGDHRCHFARGRMLFTGGHCLRPSSLLFKASLMFKKVWMSLFGRSPLARRLRRRCISTS